LSAYDEGVEDHLLLRRLWMARPRGPAIGLVDFGRGVFVRGPGPNHVVEFRVLVTVAFRGKVPDRGEFRHVWEIEVPDGFDHVRPQ
jgi:hypothetical protein